MTLPSAVSFAIEQLESFGFEAYAVGGCVRDYIMHKKPYDWDITTSAKPEDTLRIFKAFTTIPTGIQHGTITVIIEKTPLEITTYRIDGIYKDSRRPETVTFSHNLSEDLSRRDFSINAMAYNPHCGITDLFGGQEDIEAKIIRTVGNPEKRFSEDALRIMRAVRFSATLGFKIEENTARAIQKCSPLLEKIAVERIRIEFDKTLTAYAPSSVVAEYFPFYAKRIFTSIAPQNHTIETFREVFSVLDKAPANLISRLTVFLHCSAELSGHSPIQLADSYFRKMKYDRKTHQRCISILNNLNRTIIPDRKQLRFALHELGQETLSNLISVQRSLGIISSPLHEAQLLDLLSTILRDNDCFTLNQLALNGQDLITNFALSGKDISTALGFLLESVMSEDCENTKEALLNYYKTKFSP